MNLTGFCRSRGVWFTTYESTQLKSPTHLMPTIYIYIYIYSFIHGRMRCVFQIHLEICLSALWLLHNRTDSMHHVCVCVCEVIFNTPHHHHILLLILISFMSHTLSLLGCYWKYKTHDHNLSCGYNLHEDIQNAITYGIATSVDASGLSIIFHTTLSTHCFFLTFSKWI
jgi:hypothetical protein